MSPERKPIPVEQLQFRRAEPAGEQAAQRFCAVCRSGIFGAWFQAAGAFQAAGSDLCPNCAEAIRRGQQAPPAHSLLKSALAEVGIG